jgi:hypothetical protein
MTKEEWEKKRNKCLLRIDKWCLVKNGSTFYCVYEVCPFVYWKVEPIIPTK